MNSSKGNIKNQSEYGSFKKYEKFKHLVLCKLLEKNEGSPAHLYK